MNKTKSVLRFRAGAALRVPGACVVAGAFAFGVPAAPVFAAEADAAATQVAAADARDSGALEEITVTARRVEENLQVVPVAVTALSGESLQEKAILNIGDLSRSVPGFTSQASFQSSTPVYTIRGQHGDDNPTPNTEPAVQVYFAEMAQGNAIGTTGSFFDIASVQVLKGPQGTLFGRNSTGGAILVTPQAPEHKFDGYAQVSGGNYGYTDFEGALNIPLGDKAALRFGGRIDDRNGYLDDIATGRKGGQLNNDAARISLLLEPTDAIASTFIGTYYTSSTDGPVFKLASVAPKTFATNLGFLDFALFPGATAALVNAIQADAAAQAALGPYKNTVGTPVFEDDNVYSIQNNTTIRLGEHMTLKNIIGFKDTREDQGSDFSGASFTNGLFGDRIRSTSKLFSEELQLQGSLSRFDYVLGVYALHQKVDPLLAQTTVFAAVPLVFNIPPGLGFPFPARSLILSDFTTNSQSLFGHGNYAFNDQFSISAGVRVTHDKKDANFHTFSENGNPPTDASGGRFVCALTGVSYPTADTTSCATPAQLTYTEPTYELSFNYQVTDKALVYLATRRGYRAGGFDLQPGSLAALSFKPEFVNDVELGVKSEFDLGHMPSRLNAATYFQKYKDIQRLIGVPYQGSITNSTINVARADIYGGELELTVKPLPALELTLTYAYTHAQNKQFDIPYEGGSLDVADSHFAYVAQHQGSFAARYLLPVPDPYGELSLSAIWYGQSAMAAADIDTANCGPDGLNLYCLNHGSVLPAYNLGNARADWRNIYGSGFDVALFVNNVTNKVYEDSVLGLKGVLGFESVSYGAPRMYGATVRYAFGGR